MHKADEIRLRHMLEAAREAVKFAQMPALIVAIESVLSSRRSDRETDA